MAEKVLADAAATCRQEATFFAGAYEGRPAGESTKAPVPDDRKALECARYAAVVAATGPEMCEVFTSRTTREVLYRSRRAGKYEQALRDYLDLRDLGVQSADMDNQVALCTLEMRGGDLSMGLEKAEAAVAMEPGNAIFLANLGLLRYRLDDRLGAHRAFCEGEKASNKFKLTEPYIEADALSRYAAYSSSPSDVRVEEVVEGLKRAREESGSTGGTDEITAALVELSQASADQGTMP